MLYTISESHFQNLLEAEISVCKEYLQHLFEKMFQHFIIELQVDIAMLFFIVTVSI